MEPAFAWWVPHTLKKRNRIIVKVKSTYWMRTHKFGIRIPKTVEEAKTWTLKTVALSGGMKSAKK